MLQGLFRHDIKKLDKYIRTSGKKRKKIVAKVFVCCRWTDRKVYLRTRDEVVQHTEICKERVATSYCLLIHLLKNIAVQMASNIRQSTPVKGEMTSVMR